MQKLDDLNKKEMSTPGKKQFAEYVRIIKRNPNLDNKLTVLDEDKVKEDENKSASNINNLDGSEGN
jgi:hypothetical protein